MPRSYRRASLIACAVIVLATSVAASDAQKRAVPRPPAHARPAVVLRGHVFIGGYFYDPAFGPYPWWSRPAYPHRYFPVYDARGQVRLLVSPKDAAVYVDGFYAGIVEDFDGVFQPLPLPPGGHSIALFLEGYRTAHYNLYLRPGSTFKIHLTMEGLPAGVRSDPPSAAPPVPPPPPGSYRVPGMPPVPPPAAAPFEQVSGFGTLDLRVQPSGADVAIDGQPWTSSEQGHFLLQLSEGTHHLEVSKRGYLRFSTEIDLRDGVTTPMNISLPPERPSEAGSR